MQDGVNANLVVGEPSPKDDAILMGELFPREFKPTPEDLEELDGARHRLLEAVDTAFAEYQELINSLAQALKRLDKGSAKKVFGLLPHQLANDLRTTMKYGQNVRPSEITRALSLIGLSQRLADAAVVGRPVIASAERSILERLTNGVKNEGEQGPFIEPHYHALREALNDPNVIKKNWFQ